MGFTRARGRAILFEYEHSRSDASRIDAENINEYLVDGPFIGITQRNKPLSPAVPPVSMGSMPRDHGHLIIEAADYQLVARDPVACIYLRPLRGSQELLHNEQRWCLWLTALDPADLERSTFLKSRLEEVRRFRLLSKAASTRKMASTPHLFGQRSQPRTRYLAIPAVFSEKRPYFTADWLPADTIASNLLYKAEDPDGYLFSIISSSMFLTWQKTIGGALESRPHFANTITWNNFPLPELNHSQRERIVIEGQRVLDARALHPGKSLAQHYEPGKMEPALIAAHTKLDEEVDRAFGSQTRRPTERERQKQLFLCYRQLSPDGTISGR